MAPAHPRAIGVIAPADNRRSPRGSQLPYPRQKRSEIHGRGSRCLFFQGSADDAAPGLSHALQAPLELPRFDLLRLDFGLCATTILIIPRLLPALTALVSALADRMKRGRGPTPLGPDRPFEQSVNHWGQWRDLAGAFFAGSTAHGRSTRVGRQLGLR
jgi:hypothetical protein